MQQRRQGEAEGALSPGTTGGRDRSATEVERFQVQERLLLPCQARLSPWDVFRVEGHALSATRNCCCWVELWRIIFLEGL